MNATQPLKIGWAAADITPATPVELVGQYYPRVAQEVRDPLLATALALEAAAPAGKREQAILVSVDTVGVSRDVQEAVRERVRAEIPDFEPSRLCLNAIHTHNAASTRSSGRQWWTPDPSALNPEEYRVFFVERTASAAVSAWRARKPGGVSRAVGRAAVGHCRRALYRDGSAEMYGRTDRPDFVGMEGNEDSGVDLLFCWDERRELTGLVLNLACPAQVMEATYCVTADYIGEVRRLLRERHSREVFVLAQISPSGDQSPRDLVRGYRGEPDCWSEPGLLEAGRRVACAVEEAYPRAQGAIHTEVAFRHTVRTLQLPLRRASEEEREEARRNLERLLADEPEDPKSPAAAFSRFVAEVRQNEARGGPGPYDSKLRKFVLIRNNEAVLRRYETQDAQPLQPVELHAIRLGDVAFATNPFELFLEYGQRIKARSRAEQPFLVQLAGDTCGYLPTRRAVAAGGYGGLIINGSVGPEGGDALVEETLAAIQSLWEPGR